MTTMPFAVIEIGVHRTTMLGDLNFNLDTIVASLAAAVIVIGLGLLASRRATSLAPRRAQLLWETIVTVTERRVGSTIGSTGSQIVPLSISLFAFILIASWLELVPSGSPKALPPPTGDINLTLALAVFAVVFVHASSIRSRGLRGYFRHYLRPSPWLLPINVLEELVKPITLALRLFGNIFAGSMMTLLIIELFPTFATPVPLAVWKLFGMAIAVVQAFIFALLTMLYFEAAVSPDEAPPTPLAPKSGPPSERL